MIPLRKMDKVNRGDRVPKVGVTGRFEMEAAIA